MTIPTKWLTATSIALLGNAALPSFSTKQNVSFADTFFLLPTYKYLFNRFSALGFLLKTSFEKVFLHITVNLPMTIPTKWLTATNVALLGNATLPLLLGNTPHR